MENSLNNMDYTSKGQNVQRLGTNSSSELVPLVLRDLTKYDEKILRLRSLLIEKELTKGNNKYMNFYKKRLPKALSEGAFNWGVGLLLGDATGQMNLSKSKPTCRIKMQAAEKHKEYLDVTQEILKPWVMGVSKPSKNRKMMNLATLQHEAFLPYIKLFQDENVILKPGDCIKKVIKKELINHLDEITIASWYSGDGHLQFRAPQFACHGFSKEDIEVLASMVTSKFGWETRVLYDYYSEPSQRDMYFLEVRTKSAADFRKTIEPYLPTHFHYKLPAHLKRNKR